jgi:hypothetical protein
MIEESKTDGSFELIENDFVHLARLALTGRPQDIQLYIRRMAI